MFYPWFLLLTGIEVLCETAISIRNSRRLMQKGAIEIDPFLFVIMALLYIWMYVGAYWEHLSHPRALPPSWLAAFGVLYIAAKALKFWAIHSLGPYWTMRVLIIPGTTTVKSGPYRWMRHPNYLAVLMEIAATTLIGKSYFIFISVFVLFSIVLFLRIRGEEQALSAHTDFVDRSRRN